MVVGELHCPPSPIPSPLNDWGMCENWSWHHKLGELFLLPTSCRTWESRPCTSPSKHNRANPDGGGMGEPAPKLWVWETCPHYLSVLSWCGIVRDFPLTPPHLLLPPTVERDQPQHSGNGSCYSARQHSRAPWRLKLRVLCEQSSAVPIIHQTCSSMGRGKIPSPHLMPINFWERWGNWSWGHKRRRAGPTLHQLQHS